MYNETNVGLRSGMGSQVANAQEVPLVKSIPQALKDQSEVIISVHSLLNELEGRLQPVIRIEPEPPSSDVAKEVTPQTLTEILRCNNRGIQQASNRIQELLRLLEL